MSLRQLPLVYSSSYAVSSDLPGMLAGFSGLVSLLISNWKEHHKLAIITYAFGGVLGAFILFYMVTLCGDPSLRWSQPILWFIMFAALSALYADWALGAMTDNLFGKPSGDTTVLYWSYFFLKRLTMFSI